MVQDCKNLLRSMKAREGFIFFFMENFKPNLGVFTDTVVDTLNRLSIEVMSLSIVMDIKHAWGIDLYLAKKVKWSCE